jgi:hypothetical protein
LDQAILEVIDSPKLTPTLQKPEGFRVKASEGEVVVFYFEPSATQDLSSSGFPDGPLPRGPKGQQHGNIDPILRIHKWRYRRISHVAVILIINTDYYLLFAMLFMQLRG